MYKILGQSDVKNLRKRINISAKDFEEVQDIGEFLQQNNYKGLMNIEIAIKHKPPIKGILVQIKDVIVLVVIRNYQRTYFEVITVDRDWHFSSQEELMDLLKKGAIA